MIRKMILCACIVLISCNNKPKPVKTSTDSLEYYKNLSSQNQKKIDSLHNETNKLKNYDTPYMDYVDLIELFSIPKNAGYNVLSWDTGEKHEAIKWDDTVDANDFDKPDKSGCVTVKINDQFTAESDGKNVPCNWGIKLYGSHAGITKVVISTGFDDDSYSKQLIKLLKNRNYTVTKILCSDMESISYVNSVFEYESDKYKGWFHYDVSGGIGGTAETVTLYYEKPEPGSIEEMDSKDCKQDIP